MWFTPPHVNHPPPLLPRTFPLLFRRVHLAFSSLFIHNVHTKVTEDNNMIVSVGDKRFGIDGSLQWGEVWRGVKLYVNIGKFRAL